MKKNGFTLSEIIVAIGIVAVVSTVVVPTVGKIMPDKNKLKVIEYYNTINEINQKLNVPEFYPQRYSIVENTGEMVLSRYGFAAVDFPVDTKYHSGNFLAYFKYSNLFYQFLTGKDDIINFNPFSMPDGSSWIVKTEKWTNSIVTADEITPCTIDISITIDIDGTNKGNDCSYSSSCNKSPDIFIFKVDENGNVTAGDALTKAYLLNPTEMHNKKKDFEKAKELLADF